MGRLRVLHLIDHLGAGGAQELVLEILRHHDSDRFAFDVAYLFGRHEYSKEYRRMGASVACLGTAPYRTSRFINPALAFRLHRHLTRNAYDVVHVHLYVAALYGPIIARLAGHPRVLVTLHAIRDQLPSYMLPLFRLVSPFVDRFVGDLALIGNEMIAAGISARKVGAIEIGTDLQQFSEDGPAIHDIREQLLLPANAIILINIARFHPQKGQINLVRAMARVASECPDARLILVGTGDTEVEVRREATRLGVADHVVFAGFRRDLRDLLLGSDVFVMAPEREALGMATIQALAAGLPIVSFDVGAVSEAVVHERTGLLAPAGDQERLGEAIIRLCVTRDLRTEMGRHGRKWAEEHFSVDDFVSGYERLYAQVADAGY